ncbi:MAG: hypothetical protein AAB336_10450 [Acidobacteriota bacterium]
MDEIAYYIFNYCSDLLTKEEIQAHKNLLVQFKIDSTDNEIQKDMMRRRWQSNDENVLKLLENGSEEFYKIAVERVFREKPNKEFLNFCPKCNALTRTPKAKQCPKCYFSWRKL